MDTQEMIEDTKLVIRSRKSKRNRQYDTFIKIVINGIDVEGIRGTITY
jgi:hypothetical protein